MSNDTTCIDPLADLGLAEDLSSSDYSTRGDPAPIPTSARGQNALMDPTEVATAIIRDCQLDGLSDSACLCCERAVLAQTVAKQATLFCAALHRDLEVSVTRCTAWTLRPVGTDSLQ